MCQLYLTEQGSKLCRKGRRLIVRKDEEELFEVPLHRIDRIIIMGIAQITGSALALLLDRGIPLVLTTKTGRIRGTLLPSMDPAMQLRKNQYNLSDNAQYCLDFASDLVQTRAHNDITVIKRYARNHRSDFLKERIKTMDELASGIASKASIDQLRGSEGAIARQYFSALVDIFKPLGFSFAGRIRRPPGDPVNAMLSFCYILLTEMVCSAIQSAGLDVFCGFMHKPNRNAPALALDMVEQFRQPIVDRFVMLVLNRRQFSEQDFEKTD